MTFSDLAKETLVLIAKLVYKGLTTKPARRGKTLHLLVPLSVWRSVKNILLARNAIPLPRTRNKFQIVSRETLLGIFHISRVGFQPLIKHFSDPPDNDRLVSNVWVSESFPFTLSFTPIKGIIVHYFFQHLDGQGIPLAFYLQ